MIEDDYHGIDLKKKERTEIERDIIIRFTKEDLSYAVDRKTGKPLFQQKKEQKTNEKRKKTE